MTDGHPGGRLRSDAHRDTSLISTDGPRRMIITPETSAGVPCHPSDGVASRAGRLRRLAFPTRAGVAYDSLDETRREERDRDPDAPPWLAGRRPERPRGPRAPRQP